MVLLTCVLLFFAGSMRDDPIPEAVLPIDPEEAAAAASGEEKQISAQLDHLPMTIIKASETDALIS